MAHILTSSSHPQQTFLWQMLVNVCACPLNTGMVSFTWVSPASGTGPGLDQALRKWWWIIARSCNLLSWSNGEGEREVCGITAVVDMKMPGQKRLWGHFHPVIQCQSKRQNPGAEAALRALHPFLPTPTNSSHRAQIFGLVTYLLTFLSTVGEDRNWGSLEQKENLEVVQKEISCKVHWF